MKLTTLLTGTIGAGLITGGMYLAKWEEKHEGINVLRDSIAHRTQNTISPFGNVKVFGIPMEIKSEDGFKERKQSSIVDFLDKNPILRQRIQGTSWYRDFLVGKLTTDVVEKYIYDAYSIEQVLLQDPGILQKIQYEMWWKKYISGDTNPSNMLAGNIQAFISLQKIEQEQPELYNMAQKSPLWNSGIQYGEDYIVVGQREFITSLKLRLEFLNMNPGIEKKLQEDGYTRNNFFTDNWSKGEGVYGVIDELKETEGVESLR